MKSPLPLNTLRSVLSTSIALFALTASADTILTFEEAANPPWHVNPVPQSFGDFGTSGNPDPGKTLMGLSVTGLGTPDIDLTWSATGNPGNTNNYPDNTANCWFYYCYPPDPNLIWKAVMLRNSIVGQYYDLKFEPANSAKVVIKSFSFHGWYGIENIGGTNYQERFTYDWSVLDGVSLTPLTSGTYSFLSDATKNHPVDVNYTGANGQSLILRLSRVASTLNTAGDPIEVEGLQNDIAVDDITFSEESTNANLLMTSVSPADGETNTAPGFSYEAVFLDGSAQQLNPNSVQLKLDGMVVSPSVVKNGSVTTVSFVAGGLLRSGSTNRYTLTFEDSGGPPVGFTNEVTFVVQRYTSYEWRFLAGDLATDLGNGDMSYAIDAAGTTFGTTDGGTVPHIGGNPANYMHVPRFTSDTDGYLLTFNDSGPNVGTNLYINRYTLLFDVLVPSPWPVDDYMVPFFNTDVQNLNDGDFYLYSDGEIGIGSGYSVPGVITPDTWYRIAFVADNATDRLTYYVNGTNVKSRVSEGLDGRFSMYSALNNGPDLLLFNEGDGSGIYTHDLYLSSFAFTDRPLGASEAAALGGPSANGILVPGLATPPTLQIQVSGSGATVSWPTNYVGYALECRSSLASGDWLPVPGITNNAVNLPLGAQSQFYRLVQ